MLTLAPGVTLWDSGEFLAAIKTLGIPHPPGTPLYVLLGRVWSLAFADLFGFARAINLLSAVCTALGCGILASLFAKWTGDGFAGTAAGITAGLMATVWLSATETEVYAVALLFGCIILWAGDRAGENSDMHWALLAAYLSGLAWSLHLSALLVLPSAVLLVFSTHDGYFAVPVGRRYADGRREAHSFARLLRASILVALIGMSCALFMLFRARHDPVINQGNPSTFASLVDVILRRQYDVPALWPRQAPMYIQLGNLFEYADWQFAKGLGPDAPPNWWRTPITVLYALLGLVGFVTHRAMDRRSWRAMALLFFVSTIGVLVYLNLKAGPSFGVGFLPANAPHEARERDYFFFFAFLCWGLWAGFGSIRLSRLVKAPFNMIALILPFAPAILNWGAVDRRTDPVEAQARVESGEMLSRVPPSGIFLALGDNDTYPLWYLQQAENTRRDVTIVTVPLLGAKWYRAELARRYKLLDPAAVETWLGRDSTVALITKRAYQQNHPVIHSPFFAADSATAKK
ncbi:MAG: glycosyltransferase family 117 protein [Gemmatimonadaceae bacterium]